MAIEYMIIQARRGTAAQWYAANPLLAQGEFGFEYDTGKFKIGDGSTLWNSLAYSPITIQFKRYTLAVWLSLNPILAQGEPGYETDTGKFKIGDGVSVWSALDYYSSGGTGSTGGGATVGPQITFNVAAVAAVGLKKDEIILGSSFAGGITLSKIRVYSDVAPTGADLVIDIKRNGTSIWTSTPANKAKVADGANAGTQTAFDVTLFYEGDVVTLDISQVGSSAAGGNHLNVVMDFEWSDYVAPSILDIGGVYNLAPTIGAAVNVLQMFTKSGGAVADSANPIKIMIPDGNGFTQRTRAASYLSGTSIFTLADGSNYWSKGSANGELKNAWIYAIWDGTGIVFALAGYAGFTMVPTTTTVTDRDYFLLEGSSTYSRSNSHYCVCIGRVRYEYDTGDTPDHTLQTGVESAFQVIWNPSSDYGYSSTLATTNVSASDIAAYSAVSAIVKQTGRYLISAHAGAVGADITSSLTVVIKTGSATYGSAIQKAITILQESVANQIMNASCSAIVNLNAGDTIHLGAAVASNSGNRTLYGDSTQPGITMLTFQRID